MFSFFFRRTQGVMTV